MGLKSLDIENGEKVSYLINKGKNPCLVFVHGLGSNHSIWKPYFEYFGDYSIVALDLRGHGRSDAKFNKFEDFSEDLKKIIEKENIKEIVMISSCMGAKIAIDFNKKCPALIKKHVLFVPYAKGIVRFSAISKIFSEVMIFLNLFEKEKRREFFNYWEEGRISVRYPFFKEMKIIVKKYYFTLLKYLLNNDIGFEYLNKPFLILFGKYDLLVKNKKIIKKLRKNKFFNYRFLDTHHLVTTEKPKTACKAIEEFIHAKHNNTNS